MEPPSPVIYKNHFLQSNILVQKEGKILPFSLFFNTSIMICFFSCIFPAIFTVMCYNVLCDKYATRQLYGYCPSWALNWEYRKKGIIEEIRHYSADIITLQVSHSWQGCVLALPNKQVRSTCLTLHLENTKISFKMKDFRYQYF